MRLLLYVAGVLPIRRLKMSESVERFVHGSFVVSLASAVRTFIVVLAILVVGYGVAWTVVPLLAWFTPVIAFIAAVVMILRIPRKIARDREWLDGRSGTNDV